MATTTIKAPTFHIARFTIRGTSPYVQLAFPEKVKALMREKHEAGSTAKVKRAKEARDFEQDYLQAMHRSTEGWYGIPASGIRAALISACRLVGYTMTKAKMGAFVMADGFDAGDGTPMVRITKGEPSPCLHHVRNATGVADLRVRAMWAPGWEAQVDIRYDGDMFTAADIANLLMRVGAQVGVGEGRPDSKNSCGMGWGTFELVEA